MIVDEFKMVAPWLQASILLIMAAALILIGWTLWSWSRVQNGGTKRLLRIMLHQNAALFILVALQTLEAAGLIRGTGYVMAMHLLIAFAAFGIAVVNWLLVSGRYRP